MLPAPPLLPQQHWPQLRLLQCQSPGRLQQHLRPCLCPVGWGELLLLQHLHLYLQAGRPWQP